MRSNTRSPPLGNSARLIPRRVWRYRVGDYRVLWELRDAVLVILALEVGHRTDVYDG